PVGREPLPSGSLRAMSVGGDTAWGPDGARRSHESRDPPRPEPAGCRRDEPAWRWGQPPGSPAPASPGADRPRPGRRRRGGRRRLAVRPRGPGPALRSGYHGAGLRGAGARPAPDAPPPRAGGVVALLDGPGRAAAGRPPAAHPGSPGVRGLAE